MHQVWYAPREAWARWGKLFNLRSSPRRPHHHVVQTFPACSVIHGRYEDITKVDCTFTEPSQMIGCPGEGGELWLAPLRKPRRGQACSQVLMVPRSGSMQGITNELERIEAVLQRYNSPSERLRQLIVEMVENIEQYRSQITMFFEERRRLQPPISQLPFFLFCNISSMASTTIAFSSIVL